MAGVGEDREASPPNAPAPAPSSTLSSSEKCPNNFKLGLTSKRGLGAKVSKGWKEGATGTLVSLMSSKDFNNGSQDGR